MENKEQPKEKEKKRIVKRLRVKYRLLILDDETFEQKLSLLLSPMNIITFLGSLSIFLIVLVTYIIAFTGLREYIPGYTDLSLRNQAYDNAQLIDSLERHIALQDRFLSDIFGVLNDSLPHGEGARPDTALKNTDVAMKGVSEQDSLMRAFADAEERYNLRVLSFSRPQSSAANIRSFFFFAPLKGEVTSGFNTESGHFGVDVVTGENEPVKAALHGTVIMASWTYESGHVIAIQHTADLVTFYKHNSALLKKVGETVKAGDVVGIVGNSGEHTTGPHLHFELWYKGRPVNPLDYMVF